QIVATTVAITEIMDKLDLPLVGIPTSSKKLPERYADVKETGSPMGPDLEIIRMLKPDMVLSTKTLEADLKAGFEGAHLKSDFLDFTSIDSMQAEIEKLGTEFNRKEEASKLNRDLTSEIDKVKSNVAKKKKPTVLILMGVPGSYLVVTENAYIGNLVKRAGGENVITNQKVEYLASNTEYLQNANPDIILRAAHGMPAEVVKMFDEEFKTNDIWKHFDAVKNNRVYDLDENLFGMTASLNAPEALRE
ncbi:heme ABC transporter substrate-binding protein IsdE, partial [Listeria monocytogenes]